MPAQLAEQETKGATTPLEKAKDIYEYVFRTMKYDKNLVVAEFIQPLPINFGVFRCSENDIGLKSIPAMQ
ncbi:MAG: hypothetical protein WA383_18840 [Terriglobales bacterium]